MSLAVILSRVRLGEYLLLRLRDNISMKAQRTERLETTTDSRSNWHKLLNKQVLNTKVLTENNKKYVVISTS
jgi:hypothetical protein